jgi:predicted metal-dependent enzyme (double-stranded beta helix superfamily)
MRLMEGLERVDWTGYDWRKEVSDLLEDPLALRAEIVGLMSGWNRDERRSKIYGCHETSTHYKWLIYRNPDAGFTVWAHGYKSANQRRPGYAEIPHNHRYDLCSILLQGGYTSVSYEYDSSEGLTATSRGHFGPGDVLSLTHEEIHSLEQIVDGTQSLFIEGPTRKHFSTAFPAGGEPVRHYDFDGRWNDFIDHMRPE